MLTLLIHTVLRTKDIGLTCTYIRSAYNAISTTRHRPSPTAHDYSLIEWNNLLQDDFLLLRHWTHFHLSLNGGLYGHQSYMQHYPLTYSRFSPFSITSVVTRCVTRFHQISLSYFQWSQCVPQRRDGVLERKRNCDANMCITSKSTTWLPVTWHLWALENLQHRVTKFVIRDWLFGCWWSHVIY